MEHWRIILSEGDGEFHRTFVVAMLCFATPLSCLPLITQEGVYGLVGCHPKMAQRFEGTVKAQIIDLLQHPKVMALGEVGLDFSGNISKRE